MPRKSEEDRKIRLNVTVNPEEYEWLMSKVEDQTFANLSHGVQFCLFRAKAAEEKGLRP
jgi:hypothetical protein